LTPLHQYIINNTNDLISNFVHGKLRGKKKILFEGKIVFPYFLYYVKEFEINVLVTINYKLSSIFLATH